ncbi:hypothetical protein UPYG_G00327180 [Umbra pygmaea]|uniref:TFIIS N-terminal domain-containing protein n=1 Tax=Umbra pygmaea TaxID=75934 RepID=A0ABD0W2E5_UMBPY
MTDACDVVKKVLQFKRQLKESTETKTVLKVLKKLKELDITIDILAETGIGKSVNSMRKHEVAGEAARLLVTYWKNLIPKGTSSHLEKEESSQRKHLKTEVEKCLAIQGHSENLPKNECFKIVVNQDGPPSPEEIKQRTSKEQHLQMDDENQGTAEKEDLETEDKTESTSKNKHLRAEEEENPGSSEMGHFKSGQGTSENKHLQGVDQESIELKTDHFKSKEVNENALKKENQKKHKIRLESIRVSEKEQDNVTTESSKSKSGKNVSLSSEEESKILSDNRKKCGTKRDSSRKALKCLKSSSKPSTEESLKSNLDKKNTAIDNSTDQNETCKGAEYIRCSGERKKPNEKKQVCQKNKEKHIPEGKSNTRDKMGKILQDKPKEIEKPSMSFESFLSYDIGAPKRKKISHQNKAPKKFKAVYKEVPVVKADNTKSNEQLPEVIGNVSPKKDVKGSVLDLLNLPLPTFLPEYDDLSNFNYYDDKMEEKSEVSDIAEEGPVFTGQRLNRKMQVYSGSKCAFLPTMMSLYQQCIRALQNNIDLLYEIGGVPFEILVPVLERCTPNQLLRIEECNPAYMGLTDHLWEKHCKRDFRNTQLEEYESWREMHMRLSEERERKLQRLTKTIVSAHSGKPKGRQVKMAFINSVAKPPRNVRIQQEIHGTAKHARIQQDVHGTDKYPHIHLENNGTSSAALKPNSLDIPSAKAQENRARSCYVEPPRPSSVVCGTAQSQDLRKKTRVAPMMAKSLKAFKNMGRR